MMKAEISINCNIITDYEEAKKQQDKGDTVWTLIKDDKDEKLFKMKLIKTNSVGYIIIPKKVKEIILSRREEWSNK